MTPAQTTHISKFLSLVLRHEPEAAGIELDQSGWTDVQALLVGLAKAGKSVTRAELDEVVTTNAKKRFEFSVDGTRIRASQGHSIEVDLQYEAKVPPTLLYHGTATRFLDSIRANGLLKMERHHVHLAAETRMTMQVGARHGHPVLLTILAQAKHDAGHTFHLSTNGVWLVEHVPPQFIRFS
jgi:putative RNA 2'-phosphotransferase